MSGVELAAIVAAIAFVVLIIFLVLFLSKATKAAEKLLVTLDETNRTIRVITDDVDILSKEVEGLLVKTNDLVDDISNKVETIDPVFKAAADLGETVSDLNISSKNLVGRVGAVTKNTATASMVAKLSQTALNLLKKQ